MTINFSFTFETIFQFFIDAGDIGRNSDDSDYIFLKVTFSVKFT